MCGGNVNRFGHSVRRFVDDTSGAITAFTAVVFILMVVSVGMAIDFMRHEAFRAELQNALDRGSLAAASLTQKMPAKETVRSYIRSTNFVDKDYKLDVSGDTIGGMRKVTALAEYDVPTFFLRLIGIPKLTVAAYSTAREGKMAAEVSFVVDISDSMGDKFKIVDDVTADKFAYLLGTDVTHSDLGWSTYSPTRLQLMKTITNIFIDDLVRDDDDNLVSVSVVPFAGAVNPGKVMFEQLAKEQVHSHSECLRFEPDDFHTYNPPALRSLEQMAYFQTFGLQSGEVDWGSCPAERNKIMYLTNDAEKLKSHVTQLRAHSGTATHEGLKYGLTLLNPKSRDLVEHLIEKKVAQDDFKGRPFKFRSDQSRKIAIIVTDGLTQHEFMPKPRHYDEEEEIDDFAIPGNLMTWEDHGMDRDEIDGWRMRRRDGPDGTRADLRALCAQAKLDGIVIFTVAVDVLPSEALHNDAKEDMKACASDPTYYKSVESGLEWLNAMNEINGYISKLRVVSP